METFRIKLKTARTYQAHQQLRHTFDMVDEILIANYVEGADLRTPENISQRDHVILKVQTADVEKVVSALVRAGIFTFV